jgi:hypothetical protein
VGSSYFPFRWILHSTEAHQKGSLLDATVEGEDGKDVFIKRIDLTTHPNEDKIASRLGSPDSRKDEWNHCVPILDIFHDDQDPKYQYIIMPVLRPFNDPSFTAFGEVIDFVNQTLEACISAILHALVLNVASRVSSTCTIKMWHTGV